MSNDAERNFESRFFYPERGGTLLNQTAEQDDGDEDKDKRSRYFYRWMEWLTNGKLCTVVWMMSERREEEVGMKDGMKKGEVRERVRDEGTEGSASILLKFDWSPRLPCNPGLQEQSEKCTKIRVLYSSQHKDKRIPIPNFSRNTPF